MTKARDISKLLSTANGKIAGENLDVSFENITDTGTEGTRVATGTQAQRGSTQGQLRFNTTTGLAEYYDGSQFKSIDSPPTISSIDVTEVDSNAGGNQTIVITGGNFASGATVTFVGASGTDFNASTVTVDSVSQITAVAPKSSFLNAQEPYGVKVENTSGLSATLASQINVDTSPSWSTASGTIATINDNATGTHATVSATDADGDTIVYSETTSVLSGAGFSLNSSTGAITGDPTNVSSATTKTFTLRATAGSKTADRSFNIVINPAPILASALIVAGGGGGGTGGGEGGGGGAGGLVYYGSETPKTPNGSAITLTAGQTYTATIGQGGTGATQYGANGGNGTSGGNSSFTGSGLSLITALGGGTGGTYPDNGAGHGNGVAGGSGGGGGGNSSGGGGSQTGGAGTSGQGFAGGDGFYNNNPQAYLGGGGGGASEVGETPTGTRAGNGGDGLAYSITGSSVTYAGGGGGHSAGSGNTGAGSGGAGGGATSGANGTNGLGGGGGGNSGNGGSGVIILSIPTSQYTGTTTGSPTVTTSGSNTIIKFTSNGTYTA